MKTVSFPVRMSADLQQQIKTVATQRGISEQDILRLCIAIGLADLAQIPNLPELVVNEATAAGMAFLNWTQLQMGGQTPNDQKKPALPATKVSSLATSKKAAPKKAAEAPPTTDDPADHSLRDSA
jgi:hypothetical protein